MIGSQTPKAPSSCGIYDAVTLKCGNTGRLLSRRESQRGRRKRGGQARGRDNSSARAGRARMAPAGRASANAGDFQVKDPGVPSGHAIAEKPTKLPTTAPERQVSPTT